MASALDQTQVAACAAAYFVMVSGEYLKEKLTQKEKRKSKERRYWMHDIYKSRTRYNATNLLDDLRRGPSNKFQNFCRMSATDFEYLIQKIGPIISKNDTNMRKCIPVQERLAVTLRFLASGDSFKSLSYLFRFSVQTVSRCVQEVCKALNEELKSEIMLPKNSSDWKNISLEFNEKWNFPNCLGAIDGKHVVIQCPVGSETEYYNYKGTFSIVLMAVVNANYGFTFVDIGCQGRISDSGVFRNTSFFKKMDSNELLLPDEGILPNTNVSLPYVFVVDKAFALSTNIMKPYSGVHEKGNPKRIFNYRLSRARRVVENVFGIVTSVFRIFRGPILLEPEKVTEITMTCTLLHNFLRRSKSSSSIYTPPGIFDSEDNDGIIIPGAWRSEQNDMRSMFPLQTVARKSSLDAKTVRDQFSNYFVTSGKVPWQDRA